MKSAKPNSRRNFLLAAGMGTAGAAVAVATASKGVVPAKSPVVEKTKGYHASEHVLKYYRTTEV
jgi:hypothetical protein